MAQRRMFSKKITDTDDFLDMPLSAQALYFHLNMEADDDGFLGKAKTIRRKIGASEDDLKLLVAKSFLLPFDSGVVVIKDWRIHNYIRKDTYSETIYNHEKSLIDADCNGSYTFRQRSVDGAWTQDRLGKDRLGKDRERDIVELELDDPSLAVSVPTQLLDDTSMAESEAKTSLDDLSKATSETKTKTTSLDDTSMAVSEIVDYLNQKTGAKYRSGSAKTKSHIRARLSEGFTVSDFIQVIDHKTSEWLDDTKMQKYLRPETLFATKFESYLNNARLAERRSGYAKDIGCHGRDRPKSIHDGENEHRPERPKSIYG